MNSSNSVENVQNWFDAVQMYDQGIVDEAIEKFREVTKSAKILFNIGCCYLKLEEIDNAVRKYNEAIELDPHLAIAYFMLGLTNFVDEEYSEAMRYFEQSFEKLRGNRFVDYRQLGFKYQLYSCEILTNQAVCAYKQTRIRQAKRLLLQAVGCKAEKKHESIVESISLLQSGYPISPFIPPQSEIFRPSKAAVANLKKKNYLGKSQVISTENTEEIYACFSGIRDQVNEVKPSVPLNRGKLLSDIKVPDRRSTLRHVPRPPKQRPGNTGKIVESSSSSSGKKRPPPERGLPSLSRSDSPTRPAKDLPRSPSLPVRRLPPSPARSMSPPSRSTSSHAVPRNKLPEKPDVSTLPPRTTLPPSPGPPRFKFPPTSVSPIDRKKAPARPPPLQRRDNNNNNITNVNSNNNDNFDNAYSDDDCETYEEIDDNSVKYKPNRPPPILPRRNESVETETDADETVSPAHGVRVPTYPVPTYPVPNKRPLTQDAPEKPPHSGSPRKESNVSKPERYPPPPPPASENSTGGCGEVIMPPPRKYYPSPTSSLTNSQNDAEFKNEINNILKKNTKPNDIISARKKSNSTTSPPPPTVTAPPRKDSRLKDDDSAPTQLPPPPSPLPRKNSKMNYEVEVQYTFVHKFFVPDCISLEELEERVKERGVPKDIEICFNDDLGRQQALTEKKMKRVFDQDTATVKKLYCFPDS